MYGQSSTGSHNWEYSRAVGLKQHSDNGVKATKLCTDELRQCSDRNVEVADQCTRELKQHSDDSLIATDQCDTAEDKLEKWRLWKG